MLLPHKVCVLARLQQGLLLCSSDELLVPGRFRWQLYLPRAFIVTTVAAATVAAAAAIAITTTAAATDSNYTASRRSLQDLHCQPLGVAPGIAVALLRACIARYRLRARLRLLLQPTCVTLCTTRQGICPVLQGIYHYRPAALYPDVGSCC